eukprot:scaffold3349_cov165-Ochromonas_danica.AAC.2
MRRTANCLGGGVVGVEAGESRACWQGVGTDYKNRNAGNLLLSGTDIRTWSTIPLSYGNNPATFAPFPSKHCNIGITVKDRSGKNSSEHRANEGVESSPWMNARR